MFIYSSFQIISVPNVCLLYTSPALLNEIKKDGDIVVTMGAGDIWKYGEQFVAMLKK